MACKEEIKIPEALMLKIKMLIELSDTVEEADGVIEEYTYYRSNEEKFTFIEELFDVHIVSRTNEDIETDHYAALFTVINAKR